MAPGLERDPAVTLPSTTAARAKSSRLVQYAELPKAALLNELRTQQQRLGNVEAEHLRRPGIDDKVVYGRLFRWELARLRALEDLVDVDRCTSEQVVVARPVGHQSALADEGGELV